MSSTKAGHSGDPGEPQRASSTPGARRLALDAREIKELIDAAGGDGMRATPTRRSRKTARIAMHGALTYARVTHPGGGNSHWEVSLIDVSDGGAGIIYPGFLHLGTKLMITLQNSREGAIHIGGRVSWCRLLRKQFHAVGVAWDAPINARDFVPSADWLKGISNADSEETTQLRGRLVHLCTNPVEHQLLTMQISESDLSCEHAPTTGALLDEIRSAPIDVLMLDADNLGEKCTEIVARIRAERYLGPIILTASRTRAEPEGVAKDPGVQIVHKPLTQEKCIAAIRTGLLQNNSPLCGTEPIVCELSCTPEKRKMVNDYLIACRTMSRDLQALLGQSDPTRVREICESLAATGTGYGFPLLSDAAASLLASMQDATTLDSVAPGVRSLIFLVSRLRVAHMAA